MKLRYCLSAVVMVAAILPVSALAEGFEVNIEREDLRKFGNEPFFTELAVGDEAYIFTSNLCLEDSALNLVANMPISSMSEYGFNLKLKRGVNNTASGQIVTGTSADMTRKSNWFSTFGNLNQCSKIASFISFEPVFFRVLSVDGFTDMKGLMTSHFKE